MNERTESFVFRKDSAGLGVPREMFGNLHKYASEIEHGKPAAVEMVRIDRGGMDQPGRRTGSTDREPGSGSRSARESSFAGHASGGGNNNSHATPVNSSGSFSAPVHVSAPVSAPAPAPAPATSMSSGGSAVGTHH